MTLNEFFDNFNEELSLSMSTGLLTTKADEYFTGLMFDYLNEVGEINEPVICSYRDNGLQINGFSIDQEKTKIEIFVSIYNESNGLITVQKADVIAAATRGVNFYRKSVQNLLDKFSRDTDAYDCALTISKNKNSIKDVRIIVLTNGKVNNIEMNSLSLPLATVSYAIWDIERLFKCYSSSQKREPIIVDFTELLGKPLPAIKGGRSDKTTVFLAILPGKLLADLYDIHGQRLLERNVRAFLQLKGKVNKGLRESLISEPDMFLAYNNGITVTAQDVDVDFNEYGSGSIKRIKDFQIVNGGQTTVSLYRAKKDPTAEVDFSKVFVQMKLSVISDENNMDEIIPNISKYSNTQNPVQVADFSSNDPYHRKMEEISRNTWSPSVNGKKPLCWFYERTRGQYAERLNKEATPAKKRDFKEYNPLVTKTDLAKVILSWDKKPEIVSLGAQKCFQFFMERMKKEKNILYPTKEYYQRFIAKTILFRKIEKIVLAQKFGGYKANIVAYTYFKLMKLTDRRIDLDSIWQAQDISDELAKAIEDICKLVQYYLVYKSGGANVSEFSKSKKCVDGVEAIHYEISEDLEKQLLESEIVEDLTEQEQVISEMNEEEKKMVEEAMKVSAKEWQAIGAWAKENDVFESWERTLLFRLQTCIQRKKVPSPADAEHGLDLREDAIIKGFTL